MHCSHHASRTAWALALASLLTCGLAAPRVRGQAEPPAPGNVAAATGPTVIVPLGESRRLMMRSRKDIKRVVNPKDNIAVVTVIPDEPKMVLVNGREAGTTRITLTAADGTEENVDVHVEVDLTYLRDLLRRAVPSASLQLIPAASSGAVIISGHVAQSEDIDTIMRTAQSVVASPERVVNAMRVGGVMQVQLDCIVAFVSRTELRRMSFDFLDIGNHHVFASTAGGALTVPEIGTTLMPGAITNVVNAPNGAPANFFLALFNTEQQFFGLLQALRNESIAKILAQPKLVTLSGRPASLLSGGQQAIPEAAGLGSVSVRFEPFGTQLTVLPIVLGNGRIHLEVTPEVSNIDPSVGTSIMGTVVPGRNTQRVQTTVEMEDGQTLALGGLIQNTVTATDQKVPILGDLPFLGTAFSSKSFSETESELVVLVTPHLIDAMSCDQLPKALPGQETRSPDDFELFLEGILEAPRGPRDVCQGGVYVAAHKNGPTADAFPCGGRGHGGSGACGSGGACGTCSSPACSTGAAVTATTPMAASPSATVPTESDKPAEAPTAVLPVREAKPFTLPAAAAATPAVDGTK
jgi:pilus assembly protein CpaC